MMISGILLAAGSSVRMGEGNKLLLPYEGAPLFLKALKALEQSKVDELLVVLGHDFKAMLPHFNNCSIKLAINGNHLEGQTSSIKAGLQLINPSSSACLICLADMPFLTSEHIDKVIDRYSEKSDDNMMLRPSQDGRPGHPLMFSRKYYQQLEDCVDPNGCKSVVDANKEFLELIETNDMAYFADIDTPIDYEKIIRNS